MKHKFFPVLSHFRACSYGQKLSRLARKPLDKFTSEISPWYENNIKSYTAFIRDEKFSRVPRDKQDLGDRDNVFPI